jgi:hypothetical protein
MSVAGPVSADEVRFMYLIEENGDIGWRNWRSHSNEEFIKELERVLQGGVYDDEAKEKIKTDQFDSDILRIKTLFNDNVTIVTKPDDTLQILVNDICYTYVGLMRNQLHMSFWTAREFTRVNPHLCCCFLFKSRSQKLSELSFQTGTPLFNLDGSIFR